MRRPWARKSKCGWRRGKSPRKSLGCFVRKTVDLLDALREGLDQRGAPPERCKGGGPLIRLLVGLSEELERGIRRRMILPDRDHELNVAARLALLHGEMMQLAQFFGRIVFSEGPFNHVRPRRSIAQAGRW